MDYHGKMKRLPLLLLPLALPLAGCGSLNAAPTAGQLLDAPTSLNLSGQPLTAQAFPAVSNGVFSVKVKVRSLKAALPDVKVTGVYVVTNDGVWEASSAERGPLKCGLQCAFMVGSGPANGLAAGQGVQVVLGLKDTKGRELLLRDPQAQVK